MHAPFAAGEQAAPLEEAFYRPLAGLRLPPGVRFVAGVVREARHLEQNRRVLELVEEHYGHTVDLATACGLGRVRRRRRAGRWISPPSSPEPAGLSGSGG